MTSTIQDFYNGSTILITGSTGFLGKLLVEKLLRTCRGIERIYLMMRDKNGLNAEERMESYFNEEVFCQLKKENPGYLQKVSYIKGDIQLPNLHMSDDDTETIIKHVNIIFHAAATVNFHQKLTVAVDINVHGIKKIIELSRKMYNLKALIHISTVYSNCHLKKIGEKIYDYHVSYEEIIELMKTCSENELEKVTIDLMGTGPNTYTFTKALAERYISKNCQNIPVGIFRPAIVISTAKEPFPGWIDNFYGPTGLLASAVFGLLHVMHGNPKVFSNIVPADLVVNAIIASGWDVATQNNVKLPIYNFVSTQNPLTWGEYINLTKLGLNYPFSRAIWYMSLIMTRRRWLYEIYRFFLHFIPAFILDIILRILNKKPQYIRRYKKIHKYVNILSFFANTNWQFTNQNVLNLWSKLNETDKSLFNFDVSTINWHEYFQHYIKGIRLYLLKDDISTLEQSRRKYRRLFWVHQIFKYSGFLFLLYYFW